MTSVVCPVCGKALMAAVASSPVLQACPGCANRITQPAPVVNLRAGEDWQHGWRGLPLSQRPQWRREAQLLLDWMHLYQPEGPLLDVGCGTGALLEVAYDQGRDVYGVEPTEAGARHCRRLNVPVVHGDLEQAMAVYGEFRFDSIVLFRSLGLMAHPVPSLTLCRQLLSRRGQIFIEVPNGDSADARRLGSAWPAARLDQHVCHFSEQGLRHVVRAAGLRVEALQLFSARLYSDARSWKQAKNRALLAGHAWPSLDWMRVVASLPGPA